MNPPVLGLVGAYYPRADGPIMRVMDGVMAFPSILLAIGIMASLGLSTGNVVLALSVVYMDLRHAGRPDCRGPAIPAAQRTAVAVIPASRT